MPHTERMHFDHGHVRSSGLPDDVGIRLDMNRAMVKLLVDDDTAVDHRNLRWTARGRIKDPPSSSAADKAAGRLVRLSGTATNSEIRIHPGGIATLSATFSRAYVQDLRRAHKSGGVPTIDDPSRGHQS
ncbi:hypothetical protein [Streptomyces europaeiscabiei]|uniref:hypothetical protein n=1 Tax=Streptomyces europaeiscabiei TaxID=146819 RepID=UPI002E2D7BD7|nr:hypothetical protein [Streptomyces europaeiscabiei]